MLNLHETNLAHVFKNMRNIILKTPTTTATAVLFSQRVWKNLMPLRRCETASIETNVGVFVLNLWLTAHVGGNCLFLFFFFAASSHHNNSISHSDRHHNNSAKIHIQIRVNARDTQTAHYRKRTHDCIAYIIYLLPFFFSSVVVIVAVIWCVVGERYALAWQKYKTFLFANNMANHALPPSPQ